MTDHATFTNRFRAWVTAGGFTCAGLAAFFAVSEDDIKAWLRGSDVPADPPATEQKMAEMNWAIGWD